MSSELELFKKRFKMVNSTKFRGMAREMHYRSDSKKHWRELTEIQKKAWVNKLKKRIVRSLLPEQFYLIQFLEWEVRGVGEAMARAIDDFYERCGLETVDNDKKYYLMKEAFYKRA